MSTEPTPQQPDDESLRKTVEQGIAELNGEGFYGPLEPVKFVAKLTCGHDVGGETRATRIRIGSHGTWCENCGEWSKFLDIVLNRNEKCAPLLPS